VKSCTMGTKSMDYLLRKYRDVWEKKMNAED